MKTSPFISVIVPVYNGAKFLERCLAALQSNSYPFYEITVVDDGSTDNSAEISRQHGAAVVHMARQSGPAAARNFGAKGARGDILFFVDADVVVTPDTIARVAHIFETNPHIAAVFGSYDDDPSEKNFLSQYKNIFHHFVHQKSNSEANTFWAGCGAVDRRVFESVGGFDGNRYRKPSIEDIELGYRMRSHGHRIMLDKDLQVKHLKEWRLGSLLRADILCRAVPWTRLILERRERVNDLNLKTSDRISAGLVGLLLAALVASLVKPAFLYAVLLLSAAIVVLNLGLYRYFFHRKGLLFVTRAFLMHLLYYSYSSATFALCWCEQVFLRRQYRH